ncbi:MAG: hypothetical protein SV765_09935 [Pseudomonadota bacterium]|nr:hypothetical protein [Pseudomonadota bacterium]
MILSGILHASLGGFTVIRGVARLGDLAACSEFNPEYQRTLIDTHKEEIERFLADRQFLFFPEVILSASLKFDFNAYKGKRPVEPIDDIIHKGVGFKSNVNGLAVKTVTTKLPKAMETVGGTNPPLLAYLELPDDELENDLKLFRIDGNHRLSAANDTKPGEANYNLPTPFCIVLHDDATQAQRFEKVVFHNINAKQIPLTSEENLRLILQTGDDALFSDDDLFSKSSFGPAYYLARKLLPQFNAEFLGGLTKHFENRHTLALALTQFLIAKDDDLKKQMADAASLDTQVPRLREALKAVNAVYEEPNRTHLRESGCHGVLVAFAYFALKNQGKQLPPFVRWIISNRIDRLAPATTTRGLGYHYHLGRTQAVDAASLVEVFESVLSARSREVFVSMEFGAHTDAVYKAIEAAIAQVNKDHALQQAGLALKPIRIDRENKGHSYTIADEILQVINGCGLLIADLTQSNKNVYHEVGFLMGLNQGRGDPHDNFILLADATKVQDNTIGFNLRPWQQVRFSGDLDLIEKLVDSLERHFDLKRDVP